MAPDPVVRPASATPPPIPVTPERLSPDEADALRQNARVVPGVAADAPGAASQAAGATPEPPRSPGLFRGLSTLPQAAFGFVQRHPVATVVAIGLGTGLLQAIGSILASLPTDDDADAAILADRVPERHARRARRRQVRRARAPRVKAS